MHLELTARDGVPQVALERVAGFEFGRHRFVIDVEAVPARRFRAIQRKIGFLQELLLVIAVFRRHRDPDAGADFHAVARQLERLGNQLGDARRQIDRTGPLVVALGLDDREFVAAQPRKHIRAAQRRFQAIRHLPQQRVACGMSERVVDVLEAVEIEHQDRERAAALASRAS